MSYVKVFDSKLNRTIWYREPLFLVPTTDIQFSDAVGASETQSSDIAKIISYKSLKGLKKDIYNRFITIVSNRLHNDEHKELILSKLHELASSNLSDIAILTQP